MRVGRRGGWLLASALGCLVALGACGGSGSSKNPTGPTGADAQFLLQHNASFNGGRTVRWPNLPIRVFTNGIAQQNEVTEWTQASGGAVTFTFVGSATGADITYRFDGTLPSNVCGTTTVLFQTNGVITLADVRIVRAIFRGPQCQRTIVHETGHAIGFLDHTADGGLMDPDGGNGIITAPVGTMIRNLYSLPPGTLVGTAEMTREVRRGSGGNSVTIVDYARP